MAAFNKQNVLLYGGYAAFFLFCFVVFAYFTFPYERIRDVLEAKVAAGTAPGQHPSKLSIGELGPHWLSGVAMSDVAYERSGGTSDETPSRIALDELTLHASPLSLLLGGLDVDFDAEVGDGEIDGSVETKNNVVSHVDADLDAVDLAQLGLGSYLGVPLKGSGTGTIDITFGEQAAGTQGAVALVMEKLLLGDGKTKVKVPGMAGGLTVDTIDAGDLELKLAVKDGVATIEKLEAKGKDLELSGSGSIRIAQSFAQSRADITLAVKFSKAYMERSDRTKVAFELMSQNPIIKRATGADGMMRFKLTGALNALRSAPGGPTRGPKGARAAKTEEESEP